MNNYPQKNVYIRYKLYISFILLLFTGTACSEKGEVRSVATNYLKALVDYRLDDAKKFGDESAIYFLDRQQRIIDSWTPEEREKARKNLENTEVEILNIDIKETKAIVKYKLTKDGKILQSEQLHLTKNPAGWQVIESMN